MGADHQVGQHHGRVIDTDATRWRAGAPTAAVNERFHTTQGLHLTSPASIEMESSASVG